jgi:hypothetical protein
LTAFVWRVFAYHPGNNGIGVAGDHKFSVRLGRWLAWGVR